MKSVLVVEVVLIVAAHLCGASANEGKMTSMYVATELYNAGREGGREGAIREVRKGGG